MENRQVGPAEQDGKNTESSPKKRRGGDFLSQYLLRRRELIGDTHEVEEEDADEDEKPKKWRKFFRSVFKSVVTPPDGHEAKGESTSRFNPDVWFAWQSTPRGEAVSSDSLIRTEQGDGLHPSASEELLEGQSTDVDGNRMSSTSEEQGAEILQGEIEQQSPLRTRAEASHQPEDIRTPDNRALNPEDAVPPMLVQQADRTIPHDQLHTTPYHQTDSVEREVVIERGVGTALPLAAVGLEYLARKKADRRIEKAFTTKVTKIEHEAKQGQRVQQELSSLVQQNQEQLNRLKQERGITSERSQTIMPTRQEAQPSLTNRETLPAPEAPLVQARNERNRTTPEVSPRAQQEKLTAVEYVPDVESRKIMEQVADAAEHDAPVEMAFERSHEVKDDSTVTAGAVSVGAIVAKQAGEQHREAQARALQQQMDYPEEGLPMAPNGQMADSYRRAAKNGFWAALVIITLGTIAYLMIK